MTSTDAAAAPASRIFCCSSGVLIETDITPACPREDRVASHAPEGQNSLFSKDRYGIKRALQRQAERSSSDHLRGNPFEPIQGARLTWRSRGAISNNLLELHKDRRSEARRVGKGGDR